MKVPDDKLREFYDRAKKQAEGWYWKYYDIPRGLTQDVAVLMALAWSEGREYEKKEGDDAYYGREIDRRGQAKPKQNHRIKEADDGPGN